MKKLTIKDQVIAAAETLKAITSHNDLRNWAVSNGMDNRAAFPKFKAALNEIGMDYDQIKRGIFAKVAEEKEQAHQAVVAAAATPDQNIYKIAEQIGGNAWIKNEKRRIYVTGGNNYHYEGKWWVEFNDDGSFNVKCWLESGYNNKNASDYRARHVSQIEESVNEAITALNLTPADLAINGAVPAQLKVVEEYIGTTANFGRHNDEYPISFYNGCGSYYLAFNADHRIIASINFTHNCEMENDKERKFFEKQIAEAGLTPAFIIPVDGSGTQFFARNEADAVNLPKKIYMVPKMGGGKHKNIELILQ